MRGFNVCLGTFVTPQEAALEVARHKAKEEAEAAAAGHEARVGKRVDLTAEQAMEAAARDGLELEPADNKTGFSCVYRKGSKYQAKVGVIGFNVCLLVPS